MLAKHKNKIDIDGYAMLLLSTVLMIVTAGLSYAFCFRKIFHTAKNETYHCDNDVMVFVLGKKLINNKSDLEYVQRLKRVHKILTKNDGSQVIVLGGKTGDANITEAYAGMVFLEKNKKIVVVSNRYHLA